MESLPRLPLLEFNPDTLQAVRKEYNLDKPGRMDEAIDVLDDWVKKQHHFVIKDFPRDYLERTIILSKGLLERAKVRLDRYCTFKTLSPNYFVDSDVENTFKGLKEFVVHSHIPKMTPDNYRIYFFKIITDDGDPSLFMTFYKYIFILSEYVKTTDYCNGFVLVMDFTDISILNFVTKVNVLELRQALAILMEGYGMRIKAIYLITPSKTVEALVSIYKTVLSEKISKRVHIHKTVDSLYEHLPKDLLPSEYGGNLKSLKTMQDEWFKLVTSNKFEDFLQEANKAKTNECFRQTDKFNGEYIGMPGSFRKLNVD